jgi:hypothetical protein
MNRLAVLQEALQQTLSQINGIQQSGALPKRRDQIQLPGLFLDMVELEPTSDPGTGELALISHWEGRLLVSEQCADTAIWGLVQAVMIALHQFHCDEENIGAAQLKQAISDHFTPDYPGHRVWLIEWTHLLRVGDSVWNGESVVPSQLIIEEQVTSISR